MPRPKGNEKGCSTTDPFRIIERYFWQAVFSLCPTPLGTKPYTCTSALTNRNTDIAQLFCENNPIQQKSEGCQTRPGNKLPQRWALSSKISVPRKNKKPPRKNNLNENPGKDQDFLKMPAPRPKRQVKINCRKSV
jgi:hypothetical protein